MFELSEVFHRTQEVLSQETDGKSSRYPEFELSEFELPGLYCVK